jgi:hypothetical protein
MRTNYVIAAWGGKRRRQYLPPEKYLPLHFESLRRLKHSLDQITLVLPECPEQSQAFTDMLVQTPLWVEVMHRPNIGMSYGSLSDVYGRYRTQFSHYIFIEDDYRFCLDHFDTILAGMMKPTTGYLCGKAGDFYGHAHHASMSVGILRSEALEAVWLKYGCLPHARNTVYLDCEHEGQVNQSVAITNCGYDVEDILASYSVQSAEGETGSPNVRTFGNGPLFIEPILRDAETVTKYHSLEAFQARMARRQASPKLPEPLAAFYHICCMNEWQKIVTEQLQVLQFCGLDHVSSCVLGTANDAAWCQEEASKHGVSMTIATVINDFAEYENPTLMRLYEWAKDNEQGSVMYFHTKGVSASGDYIALKRHWRRLMAKHTIAEWKRNLALLQVADMVGVSWQHLPNYPHFCGNFWMARCDWISHLCSPVDYKARHDTNSCHVASQPWKRMHCEMWIGSEPYHHIESFCNGSGALWTSQVYRFPVQIDGFTYPD